jgi:hypothetical protein
MDARLSSTRSPAKERSRATRAEQFARTTLEVRVRCEHAEWRTVGASGPDQTRSLLHHLFPASLLRHCLASGSDRL